VVRGLLRPTSVSNGWLGRFGRVTWRVSRSGGRSAVVLAAVVVLFGRCVGSGCRAGVGAAVFGVAEIGGAAVLGVVRGVRRPQIARTQATDETAVSTD